MSPPVYLKRAYNSVMSRKTINLQTALHKGIRSEEVSSSFVQVRKIINQSNDERFWCGCLHISFVLFSLTRTDGSEGKTSPAIPS